ncbi:hypothetical protein, partial [Escherichia coli]|uniref:hypothetical protein n=1 Tax=Escherichia coli TaxID=562 RepID=UPI003218909D
MQHTQQLVLGSLAFMVVFLHWLTKPTKAAAGIGLAGTVAKLAMRQPFVLFKGLTFQKLCLPGAFR